MLKNAYLGAKIGFDTAANELSKVCPLSVYRSPRFEPIAVPEESGNRQPNIGISKSEVLDRLPPPASPDDAAVWSDTAKHHPTRMH